MTPSLSARLPRPTGRPRVPNAGPAPVLALWPAAALAPGRVAAHVWHGQTRLGERFLFAVRTVCPRDRSRERQARMCAAVLLAPFQQQVHAQLAHTDKIDNITTYRLPLAT